ncbi:MAG: hypothetical protein ACREAD_06625 [Nitrosopumilaceae archaeon]
MGEYRIKMLLSQSQPMKIIMFCFLPTHFGYFIPWESAAFIFSAPILFLLAIANLGHVAILEWSYHGNLKLSWRLIMVYLIFLCGFIAGFPSLYADTMEILFNNAHVPNIHLTNVSNGALAFAVIGGFLLDIYYLYDYKIASKITSKIAYSILSRV